MLPLSRTAAAVVLAVVSLAAFALGRFSRPADAPPALAATSQPTATPAQAPARREAAPDTTQTFDDAVAEPTTGYWQRLRLAQAAADLDRAGVVAALEREHARVPQARDPDDRTWPTEALLARYAEIDPAAAMAWLLQTYRGDELSFQWQEVVMEAWVDRDRKAAAAWVRGLPPGTLRDTSSRLLFNHLVETDPEMALRQGVRLGSTDGYNFERVFIKLAENDVRAARERALQLPPDQSRWAVDGVMNYWTEHQPEDAYAWALRLPAGIQQESALATFYRVLAAKSPPAAAAWLTTHARGDLTQEVGEVVQAWVSKDPTAARAWAETLPMPARQQALAEVVGSWANTDPRAALDYAVAAHLADAGNDAITPTLSIWARRDPAAAIDWVDKSALGSVRQPARQSVYMAWAQENARGCVEYLSQHAAKDGSDAETNGPLSSAVSQWAYQSPDEVWQWSQGVTDPKIHEIAAVSALGSLARSDPATACARVTQLPPESQSAAADAIVSQWVASDPAAACVWAASLPTEAMQKSACGSAAGGWAYTDAPGAAAWVEAQPPGAGRDAATAAVLDRLPPGQETVAARLAAAIQDPQARESALTATIQNWVKRDRPAAEAWVAQAQGFTSEQRARFLNATQTNMSEVY